MQCRGARRELEGKGKSEMCVETAVPQRAISNDRALWHWVLTTDRLPDTLIVWGAKRSIGRRPRTGRDSRP